MGFIKQILLPKLESLAFLIGSISPRKLKKYQKLETYDNNKSIAISEANTLFNPVTYTEYIQID